MDARLEYCDNYIEFNDFRHYVEEEINGNPYNCKFNIKVSSGMFSGFADLCECNYKELKQFISRLDSLLRFETSEATFIEIGYGSKIHFRADNKGHIVVAGDIYGDACSQRLFFKFMTDQTAYPPFVNSLKKL